MVAIGITLFFIGMAYIVYEVWNHKPPTGMA